MTRIFTEDEQVREVQERGSREHEGTRLGCLSNENGGVHSEK